ncbi:MAG: lysophospholipid acyltransferase family protein, partial [Marinirhabdus sp.]
VLLHPIQWVALNGFGYQAHKNTVDVLNWFILRCLNILGTRFQFENRASIPNAVPVIIASNHQSMWDIPPLYWFLRRCHPKFISKIELAKGIPSISYNLRHGGSVLIDRNDPEQALQQIEKMARYISLHNRSVVIFPEGTRSRTGTPKPFKRKGLRALLANAPKAYVLPVRIENSWQLQRYGFFPMPLGTTVKITAFPAVAVAGRTPDELINVLESTVNGPEPVR